MKKQSFCLMLLLAVALSPSMLFAQNFKYDIDLAKQEAVELNRPIALVFSGSDWCKPCIQLKTNILQSSEFVAFSDENLVLVELDFPYRKKNRLAKEQQAHNEQLAQQYNSGGVFPLIVFINADGTEKGRLQYDSRLSVEAYIEQVNALILL